MSLLRLSVYLISAFLVSTHAFAKTETLAERGKRMCEEAGVPLDDCTILPPELRGNQADTNVATAIPEPRPLGDVARLGQAAPLGDAAPLGTADATPAPFGTGKYGWCEDCTSLLAAAPVTPWSTFGGRRFQPKRDEDDRRSASSSSSSLDSSGDDDGGDDDGDSSGDGGGDNDGGSNGGDSDGGGGDDGGSGGGDGNGDGGGNGGNGDGNDGGYCD